MEQSNDQTIFPFRGQGYKIIIAGGGTGGHIYPAIAIAQALERMDPGVQLLFVGAKNKMEMEKVPQAGYKIKGLDIAGMDRGSWVKNISLPLKLLKSMRQAKQILKSFKPDAVVGVGGYASFPVLSAAQRQGISTVIQEQNSYAGKSNKILGRKAKKICVAYDDMERFFPKERIVFTGNPVRDNIVKNTMSSLEARSFFGLKPDKKTLFIVGGSLGAKAVNEAVAAGIKQLVDEDIQVIWQTGKLSYENVLKAAENYSDQIKAFEFIKEIEKAYSAADVVISRAGALSISELCVAGKAVIFVPYPFAAEDHQTKNAQSLVNKNAAWMVANEEAGEKLVSKTLELFKNENLRKTMAENIKTMAITHADERIAEVILETI